MKCTYHPESEAKEFCSACSKTLCSECAHQIKGKYYCQDCLVQGAEWATAVKDLRIPIDSPRRAAVCSLIPGMGAVYNNEYMKALTYFAVFAALVLMADRIHDVFGFAAFAFVIFTMFDSYRTAEARTRARLEGGGLPETCGKDRTPFAWGVFLVFLGVLFLLQNIIPFYFLNKLWPLVFILLGGYLVWRSLQDRREKGAPSIGTLSNNRPL